MASPVVASENSGFISRMIERFYGYDLFISYNRQDDPNSVFALTTHALLSEGAVKKKRLPMRCFLDLRDMPHDDELRRAIEQKIFASRFVLFIAGVHSADHEWMSFEAEMARKHRKRTIVVDRGVSWKETTGLLKRTVGDVLAIRAIPLSTIRRSKSTEFRKRWGRCARRQFEHVFGYLWSRS